MRISRRLTGTIAVLASVAVVGGAAGATAYRQVIQGGGGGITPPPIGTANLWIDTNGGTCSRQATAANYADAAACSSFQTAYSAASCGDTVGVAPGTYASQTISSATKSCTSATPVTITSVPGSTCTDNTPVATPSVNISVSYLKVSCVDANINTTSCSGIGGASGQHGNIVWDTFDHMDVLCAFFDSDHMRITNTTFGPANTCLFGQEDLTVFRSNPTTILDVVFDGDVFKTVTAPPDFECGIGQHVDSMQGYGIALTIRNTIFYGCPGQCIILRPFNGGIPGPITFENDEFNQAQSPGQAIDLGSSTQSDGDQCSGAILIQNNDFVNGAALHGGFWNTTGCSVTIRNNIMSSNTCNFGGSLDTYTNNVFYSGTACGSNTKACTPSYIGSTSSVTLPGDFHLNSGDTCAQNAADQVNFPTTDIDGESRPRGAGVDAGFDEVGSSLNPTFNLMFAGADTDRTVHTFTLTGSAPVGSLVVACTSYSVDNETTVGMTDSKGNTWNKVYKRDQTDSSANMSQDFWYTVVTSALSPGDSVSMPVDPVVLPIGNSLWSEIWDVQNGPTTLDQTAQGQTNFSTSHASPSITTTTANEVMFGCHTSQSIGGTWWTPGANWTDLGQLSTNNGQQRDVDLQRRVVSTSGTYTSTGTTPSSAYTIDSIVSFK